MYISGLTEEQIAERCGLSTEAISDWRQAYGFRKHVVLNNPDFVLKRIEGRNWHLENE